jgi:hypothetical protein
MTKEQYINAVLACLLGIILQVIYKITRMKNKAKISNTEFSIKEWLKDDSWVLVLNIISPFIIVWAIDEWLAFDNKIADKIKSIFVFVGFSGSQVIMGFLSVADKKFNKIIDDKTNVADHLTKDKEV